MLTQSERLWAVNAKMRMRHKDGFRCGKCGVQCYFLDIPCPLIVRKEDKDWEIEFQTRVAAKLALGCESQTPCHGCWRANWKFCNLRKGYWDCADCFLKTARLIVEEEMDADG